MASAPSAFARTGAGLRAAPSVGTMSGEPDYRQLHDEENADFSALLHNLEPEEWDRPSLCEGWKVRDVVGHILYGNELKLYSLPLKLARFGFSSDRSGEHYSIERATGQSPASLVADFDARDPWAGTCRVFPPRLTLLDRLAHHQDIRRALDRPRHIPPERLEALLPGTPKLGSVFGAKRRTKGLRLEATDLDWTWGEGPTVTGPGEALFMAMLGRSDALSDLDGDGLGEFRSRLNAT